MKKAIGILYTFIYLLIAAVVTGCNQQPSQTKSATSTTTKLTVKSMQDDLFILWSAIKEMHPGYGLYTPADSLQAAYNKTYQTITQPLYENEFIAHIYPLICKLRCGHTQIRHSDNYKPLPSDPKEPHLPFEVLVRNHHAWVTTHATQLFSTGDEVISINDVPVTQIINNGYNLYCGDGYIQTFKELFLSEYDGFEDACFKYYHWQGPYRIKLLTKQGAIKSVTENAAATSGPWQSLPERPIDNYAGWVLSKNTGYLPLRFLKNTSTALFEAKTFQYADTTIYTEAFKQIQQHGIKNLIIDLRHNTGGDIRIAEKLLSFLADSSFYIVKDVKSRVADPTTTRFEQYFDTARTESFRNGFAPGNKEGNWYHINIKPVFGQLYGRLPLAKKYHYHGNVYALIDGATFSSAALFTAAFKAQCKNVKFIGRETAGNEEGCNGGTLQRLTLPNTKIVVDFPWMHLVSVANNPIHGRGIMPNYYVDYTAENVVSKKDLDLQKAISLIK